ncbi:VTT domain-containing protein [Halodesulfurarchaeum sp.]|uniref:VTT domain-containing protein n=1 Tax=Halodesulfurarchaeum sp. TaxID=1980530 RepID=UPI001BBC0713|nr:VTT domain-containing protein [Halodesulfurarchaeum sp.]
MLGSLLDIGLGGFEAAVAAASGWSGLGVIFVYSILIAFVLPLPSEIVLCPVGYLCPVNTLALAPLPYEVQLGLVIVVSGLGKAIGSVIALLVGHNASHSGIVIRSLRRLGFQPLEWSQRTLVKIGQRWGHLGMAVGLSVPFFPDTASIYAFSVIESSYTKFAAAAFAGSVGRLGVTMGLIEGALFFI